MAAPQLILDLVRRFADNRIDYQLRYNETQLRREFLDPLFKALGWDVDNERGYAEAYKDVIHEDAIRVGGSTKAPDYSFRVGGTRKFFLEAKRPSVNIAEDREAAFQLRRYAWSAGLPLSILSDFAEFAVYDCRIKPNRDDRASTSRTLYLTCDEYASRWDEIASLFSHEAVLRGAFDRFAEETRGRRGTTTVDAAFLEEIERWRDLLAKRLALRNRELSTRDLNFAVQRTIDRVIFLRICEDRGIEPQDQLRALLEGADVYARLCQLFYRADERYNSGLFHFQPERGRAEAPDTLTLDLSIDDATLKEIIKSLYYPNPYEFSVLPADILGQVYERFLGKVIRLTPAHQAKVEEKPEVRKAGGVYYTPTFIVRYIVENTIGSLTLGKTPKQLRHFRVLDPACGSGSFLIGAYQYLLDWHRDWYVADGPQKHRRELYEGTGGEWRLATPEKRRILLNNIYGVDIDQQAVEVTKLSLLLKVLEGESEQTLENQLRMFHERALPDLGSNIKCGNSLIASDFYDGQQLSMLDEEEQYRVNVFDWEREFPDIMRAGSFDAVIGNPPYLRIQGLQEYYGNQIEYFIGHYQSAVKRFDLYLLFAEKGFNLLNKGGCLGFICPHKFLNSDFGSGLREFFIKNAAIKSFVSFGNNLVFKDATTYTGVLLLKKDEDAKVTYYEFPNLPISELPERLEALTADSFAVYDLKKLTKEPWVLSHTGNQKVLSKLSQQLQKLGDVFSEILVGVQSGIDNVHVLEAAGKPSGGTVKLFSQRADEVVEIEEGLLKPFLRGEDVHRYSEPLYTYYCIYPYQFVNGRTKIIEEDELRARFPLGYAYLNRFHKELAEIRIRQKTNPRYWYSCHRSRDMGVFESERIVTPEISLGCNMTFCDAGLYHNTMVYSLIPSTALRERLDYWLGLLNSKVMWWFLANTGNVLRGGYFRFKTNYLSPFPIRTINFSDPADKARHDRMVALVEQMLTLNKQVAAARTPNDRTRIERMIDATDRQIDRLVYELYELTDEEIRIVEEATTI